MMVIAMNNDFAEMFEKMKKRKLRKYRLYIANIVYQWICVLGLMFYSVMPFIFRGTVGIVPFYSNLVVVPFFATFLYHRTKQVIKTKDIPQKVTDGFLKRSFDAVKLLLPSIVCGERYISSATCRLEVYGLYVWLTRGLIVPILFFAILISYYSAEHGDGKSQVYDIDFKHPVSSLKSLLRVSIHEIKCYIEKWRHTPKKKQLIVYISNIIYQWACIKGMVLYMAAPFVFNMRIGIFSFRCNYILIPLLTVVLFNQTKALMETKDIPQMSHKNKFKEIWSVLVLMLPSIAVLCEWGNLYTFLYNSLSWYAAIIVAALLPILFFVASLSYISYKKENKNE